WLERAAFEVAFDHATDTDGGSNWQTRVYHEEADGRMDWPGIAGEALMTWMRERADLPAESPVASAPVAAPEEQPVASAPVAVSEEQPAAAQPVKAPAVEQAAELRLAIDQFSLKAAASEQEVGGAASESRLDAQISFHLSGVEAYLATANQSQYLVQVLAHDVSSNHATILALEGRQFEPELLEY